MTLRIRHNRFVSKLDVVKWQRHCALASAAYEGQKEIRVILGQMRAARNAPRWRELHERLSVSWRRYRMIQDWRYER